MQYSVRIQQDKKAINLIFRRLSKNETLMQAHAAKILMLFTVLILASCGAKVNTPESSKFTASEMSFLLIEKQCTDSGITMEPVSREIEETYKNFKSAYPMAFFVIPPQFYDYKSPLIISLSGMEKRLSEFKTQQINPEYLQANLTNMGITLHYLYQQVIRFEGQKCAFTHLKNKKFQDLRPFLELKDFCTEKNQSERCSAATVAELNLEDAKFVESRTVKLCNTFDRNAVNCQAQYSVKKQSKTLGDLVSFYQKRFQEQRYDKLFKLKKSHLTFQCQKAENSIEMKIKVSSRDWNQEKLLALTQYVSTSWSRGNFKLTFDLVNETGSDVVQIIPTNEFISYVPDANNRQVYLSQKVDPLTQMRVLSHEFGHVLGFPDCYTEFFDNKSNELIYYEIDKDNTNIMCSLKSGVSVPDDYMIQLSQKSCVFN